MKINKIKIKINQVGTSTKMRLLTQEDHSVSLLGHRVRL